MFPFSGPWFSGGAFCAQPPECAGPVRLFLDRAGLPGDVDHGRAPWEFVSLEASCSAVRARVAVDFVAPPRRHVSPEFRSGP